MFENIILTVSLATIGGIVLLGGIIWLIMFQRRYETAASNQALIITGPNLGDPETDPRVFEDENGRSMLIVRGGGHRRKFFQHCEPVDLNSFQIQLTTPKIYTLHGVPVIADAITTVKIADSLNGIANFAEQFLGKEDSEIREEVAKVLGTNLRAILSKMTVEQINNDRETFNQDVQKIAQEELDNMGFKITSFGLDDLRDADRENGYLENLGRPQIAEVRKRAEMAESDSDRETRMYKAKNDQEAQDEENKRQTRISESRKEKDIKEAEIKEVTERARAKSEQAYALEKVILEQQIKEEQMKVEFIERQKQVEFEQEEQKRRKAQADTEAYQVTAMAEAEAKKARIQGETQAKITLDQGTAEAEAKRLMAEAMSEFGQAAIMEMMIKILPELAREISAPLANISEMKVIDMGGEGSNGGMSKITKGVTNNMVGVQEVLKEATGMDIKALMDNYTSRGLNLAVPETETPVKEDLAAVEN